MDVVMKVGEVCTEGSVLCWMEAHPGLAAWAQLVAVVVLTTWATTLPLTVQRRAERIATFKAHERLAHNAARVSGTIAAMIEVIRLGVALDAALPNQLFSAVESRLATTDDERLTVAATSALELLRVEIYSARRIAGAAVDDYAAHHRVTQIVLNEALAAAARIETHRARLVDIAEGMAPKGGLMTRLLRRLTRKS